MLLYQITCFHQLFEKMMWCLIEYWITISVSKCSLMCWPQTSRWCYLQDELWLWKTVMLTLIQFPLWWGETFAESEPSWCSRTGEQQITNWKLFHLFCSDWRKAFKKISDLPDSLILILNPVREHSFFLDLQLCSLLNTKSLQLSSLRWAPIHTTLRFNPIINPGIAKHL